MEYPILPNQPPLFISYLRVGKLLYLSLLLFIAESLLYWKFFQKSQTENIAIFWYTCFLFSFVHIFLVLMDGWSRFQNYKKIKDLLYLHGFNARIIANYKGSRCQRSAAIVAAQELGMEKEVRKLYKKIGVKDYHILPGFMVKDPFFLFKNSFWYRTFMEKYHPPRFNFRKISKIQFPIN